MTEIKTLWRRALLARSRALSCPHRPELCMCTFEADIARRDYFDAVRQQVQEDQ